MDDGQTIFYQEKPMNTKEALLNILEENKGISLSGSALAERIGVSRNAVWKAIKALEDAGHKIRTDRKGYQLEQCSSVLTPQSIEKYLHTQGLVIDLRETLTSTNTELKRMAEQGAKEGTVLIARHQTAGKGRRGRSFYSPAETGIYFSILLKPQLPAEDALLITTCAAVAVAQTLEAETQLPCGIKWVNDVFCNGKKVCGILTEASIDLETGGLNYAILGIGINIFPPKDGFPDELKDIAGSVISAESAEDHKSRILAGVLDGFFAEYPRLTEKNFLEEYRRRSIVTGKTVDVIRGDSVRRAQALAIDHQLRLLVRYEDGTEEAVSTGEVSIRV